MLGPELRERLLRALVAHAVRRRIAREHACRNMKGPLLGLPEHVRIALLGSRRHALHKLLAVSEECESIEMRVKMRAAMSRGPVLGLPDHVFVAFLHSCWHALHCFVPQQAVVSWTVSAGEKGSAQCVKMRDAGRKAAGGKQPVHEVSVVRGASYQLAGAAKRLGCSSTAAQAGESTGMPTSSAANHRRTGGSSRRQMVLRASNQPAKASGCSR